MAPDIHDRRTTLSLSAAGVRGRLSLLIEEAAGPVHIITGGADGTLIYIDAQGHIHRIPPEGPGPVELRGQLAAISERLLANAGQLQALGQQLGSIAGRAAG